MGNGRVCLAKTVVEPAKLLRVSGLIAAAFLVFCVPAYVQNTSSDAGLSAGARKTESLFQMLPDAVTASYGKREGELVEILFKPNPDFHPPSHEAAVFHAMAGQIWINTRQTRLVEIEGHLTSGVKFGGGLLGHLDKAGEFHVKQSEVAPGLWEITLLHVNMHGKALFFKTIAVQENEIRTNFQRVPDNLALSEAAQQLQKRSSVKSAFVSGGAIVPAIGSSQSSSD